MTLLEQVTAEFERRYGEAPAIVVRAPGRVNLIGEHTDYNDGFVLPMAIDRAVWIALRSSGGARVAAWSLDFDEPIELTLESFGRGGAAWGEYLKGVAWALQQDGCRVSGWEGVVAGDVPIGAGLSSSAALELAAARAFAAVSDLPWDPAAMARIAQRAENEWVGVRCGIMDQMVSAAGREGNALLIDCRSLETQAVPLPPGMTVVVMDTATRRGLLDSAYNERREQCEAAARFFGVPALRDVTAKSLAAKGLGLEETTLRRARHVVSENARTLQAADAMRRGDAEALGRLMSASHVSLRDDFEVSSRELDLMVECALRQAGCLGARMTGAGFGGCAVALARAEASQAFVDSVASDYRRVAGLEPRVFVCRAAEGAEVVAS
jgi:galactokinase